MVLGFTYVQGSSPAPTPDCCSGLKSVLSTNPKCLCVLVKDNDDPQLGVKINLTRALILSDSCRAAANISHCPAIYTFLPQTAANNQCRKELDPFVVAIYSRGHQKIEGFEISFSLQRQRR
ncbi:hypothetical protein KSP40_PGU002145 [Platanthera guangdongensis]|uniref:Bifunctional inhibitor/plant lipid transfer protein/seed storage helical domain-containing protein n=1 Tax=Platanthera guangdongensis TaxID=2320717 RepID=A0ABR2LQF7_9ASPA